MHIHLKNSTKITILTSSFLILWIVLVILFSIGNFLYNIAINPNVDKSILLNGLYPVLQKSAPVNSNHAFFTNNEYLDRYIESEDRLTLHAYEFHQPSDRWVIVVHGYLSEGKEMANIASHFYENNYNVLVLDLRSHGKSEGEYIGMGWDDRKDVILWAHLIQKENPHSKIVLYGVSMGAATIMNATGEKLPVNIKAAIEDCGYTSTWDILNYHLNSLVHLPTHPFLDFADLITQLRAGYSFKEGGPLQQVRKSSTPTLFIHGSKDDFVPYEMLDTLYDAASCQKQKLVIEGAGHAQSAEINPFQYWSTIDHFLSSYIH